MAEVLIDGDAIQDEKDLHRALASELDFGQFYGANLAALRDRLLADVPRPLRIVWLRAEVSRSTLGEPLFSRILDVFEEASQQDLDFGWTDRFEFELR